MFLLSHCASRKEIVNFKNDVVFIKGDLDIIRHEIKMMQTQVTEVNKNIQKMEATSRKNNADMLAEISSLKNQTLFLDNKLEDTSYRMDKILHQVNTPPASSASDTLAQIAFEKNEQEKVQPQALYNLAYLDYTKSNYELALEEFSQYLKLFPQGEFADNAQYWIGEIYYAQRDFRTAMSEFQKVIVNHPRGRKTAAATLKIGLCRINLNDITGGRQFLENVQKTFPNSDEARIAGLRLKELDLKSKN